MLIENKSLGFTSDDVMACDSVSLLQEWLMEQQMDVASIDMQIDVANQYKLDCGEYANEQHYKKLKRAQMLQKNLYSLIKKRLEFVRSKQESLKDAIITIFRANLTDEEWERIEEEARSNLS